MRREPASPAAEGFRISIATSRQREVVLQLWLELIDHHRRLDPNYPVLAGLRELLGRELDRALRADRSRVWIADADGEPRAFLLAEIESDRAVASGGTCWVHEVYVQDEFRRRGIASALVANAEEFFRQASGGRRAVRVEASNRAAQRFWERAGFSERARILERPA